MRNQSSNPADLGGIFDRYRTSGESELRIGDAERQQTVERLTNAHGLGYLDLSEFDERSSKAWNAKTEGDLATLIRDLPSSSTRKSGSSDGRRRTGPRGQGTAAALGMMRIALGVFLALMVVGFILGHLFFILPWVLLFMFLTGRIGRGRQMAGGPRFNQRRW